MMPEKLVKIIAAVKYHKKSGKLIIGDGAFNGLPWKCKEDMDFFKKTTRGGIVVMGRRTFDSINRIPLKNRVNLVITRHFKENDTENLKFVSSFKEANEFLNTVVDSEIFVIGGGEIYKYFLEKGLVKTILLTEILLNVKDISVPIYFPEINSNFKIGSVTKGKECNFLSLEPYVKKHECLDSVYSNITSKILKDGVEKDDRTGTGTISLFGPCMRIYVGDLSYTPILTTKWVAWKSCIKELLWFLKGETNSKILSSQGVKVWDGNTSRKFLDSRGLDYPEGEMGPGYGWQIRRSGAKFPDTSGGVDQLKFIEKELKTNPDSRRIMWNLWNPVDLDKMSLVPCHNQIQFYSFISQGKRKLSLSVYIRSNDMFLGNPFNFFSYYVFLRIMCLRVDMHPHEIIFNIGDAHIYNNHIGQILLQNSREKASSPVLFISERLKDIDYSEMTHEMFDLIGYFPKSTIYGEMSV